jgi:predicted nucleic acid-binding protein
MTTIEDLPTEAAALLVAFETEAAAVRAEVDDEARRLHAEVEAKMAKSRAGIGERVEQKAVALLERLRPLQRRYLEEGMLDEALAVREAIRHVRKRLGAELPSPMSLAGFEGRSGERLSFTVQGNTTLPVWGTDLYTLDSRLASAAVHAGVLLPGETRVIHVQIEDTSGVARFEGSSRNGVTSLAWGPYRAGFRVFRE